MIALDCNLIAYEYSKNQFVPKEVYPSGERDENKNIDKYSNGKTLPVLILEDDIINKDCYGLKKGFYNVVPDKYMDFLLILQAGELKAKIPVINMEVFEPIEPKQEKPKKMSASRYKKLKEKEYRKYLKGENPEEFNVETVEIQYMQEDNTYLLIYNSKNIELLGLIKF